MSAHKAMQAVRDEVAGRGLTVAQLVELVDLVPTVEPLQERAITGGAIESVLTETIRATEYAPMSDAEMFATLAQLPGHYTRRSVRARVGAAHREAETRYPAVEPLDTWEESATVTYPAHSAACYAAAAGVELAPLPGAVAMLEAARDAVDAGAAIVGNVDAETEWAACYALTYRDFVSGHGAALREELDGAEVVDMPDILETLDILARGAGCRLEWIPAASACDVVRVLIVREVAA